MSGPHADAVKRGVDWLVAQQDSGNGLIGEVGHEFIYGHGLATITLCRALRSGGSPALGEVIKRARDAILARQLVPGGWRYNLGDGDRPDSSVTAWMIHALHAVEECGFPVPTEARHFALTWLDGMVDEETGRVGYDDKKGRSARIAGVNDQFGQVCETLTAAGLYARLIAGQDETTHPSLNDEVSLILTLPPRWDPKGTDFYGWYHATNALFLVGGKPWKKWNAALREGLEAAQVDDPGSHAHGSFSAATVWGGIGGRVYTTAISALILEVYYSGG